MMPNGPGACPAGPGLASPAAGLPAGFSGSPPSRCCYRTVIMTMRLRTPHIPVPPRAPPEKSSHLVFLRARGATEAAVTAGETWDIMTAQAQAHDTITAARPARRADAGTVRLSQRDIDGLMLCGEHYGAPVRPARPGAAGAAGAAARDRGAVAPRRVRGYRAAGSGAGVVLADPGRDDRDRPGVPRHPPRAGPPGPHPRGPGGPAVAGGQPGLEPGPALVAFRAAAARRPPRRRAPRARRRRGDPLAVASRAAPTPGRYGRSRSSSPPSPSPGPPGS